MATPETGTPDFDQTHEDGQEETINWEKRYKDAQAEITRARQELSEYKKQAQQNYNNDTDDDPDQVKAYLKPYLEEMGYVSKEHLEREKAFNNLLDSNPELKHFGEAIKTIAEKEGLAYEDVVERYGFNAIDKVSKAKDRGTVGDKSLQNTTKSVLDASEDERNQWKKNNIGGRNNFKRSKTF